MIKNLYKIYLLTFGLIVIGFSTNASNVDAKYSSGSYDISSNWLEIKNENGITTFIKQGLLDNEKVIYVKFESLNSEKIEFAWSLMDQYGSILNKDRIIIMDNNNKKKERFILAPQNIDFSKITINIKIK